MATLPTQKTLERLKAVGLTNQVVERWNPFARRRVDLFGVIDIVALSPGTGILGIQTTSGTNHANRVAKAIAEPRLRTWLESGGRFEVWSWSKKGPRGKRKTWELRRQELKIDDVTTP